MGDIASNSRRFVAGCARYLRTARDNIRTTDDEDGLAEPPQTGQAGQRRDPSITLAGALLASSMAVAGGSRRLRAALASIPLADDEDGALEGDRAQAGLRRRLAMASPAVAAGLLAAAVTATPAEAAVGDKVRQGESPQPQGPRGVTGGAVTRTRDVPVLAPTSTSSSVAAVAAGRAEEPAALGVSSGRKVRASDRSDERDGWDEWRETVEDAISPRGLPDPRDARDRDGEARDRGGEAPARDGQTPVLVRHAPDRDGPTPDPAPRATPPAPAGPTFVPSVVLSGDPAWLDHAVRAMEAGWDDVSESADDAASVDVAAASARAESGESEGEGSREGDDEAPSDPVDGHDDEQPSDSEDGHADEEPSDSDDGHDDEQPSDSEDGHEDEEPSDSDGGGEGSEPDGGAGGGGEPAPAPAPESNEAPETPGAAPAPEEGSAADDTQCGDDGGDEPDGDDDDEDAEGGGGESAGETAGHQMASVMEVEAEPS